jgi:hypothetical protein
MKYQVSLEGFKRVSGDKYQSDAEQRFKDPNPALQHAQFYFEEAATLASAMETAGKFSENPHKQIATHPLQAGESLAWVALLFNNKAEGIRAGIPAELIEELRPDLFRFKVHEFSQPSS